MRMRRIATKGLFSALVLFSTALGTVTASDDSSHQCATDLDILIPRINTIHHGDSSPSVHITTTVDLHQYLLRCADTVQSLKLRTASQGCSEHPDRYNLPFDLAGGERYPNLTSLSLDGYDFHQSEHLDTLPRDWRDLDAWKTWLTSSGYWGGSLEKWWRFVRKTPIHRLNRTNLELFLEAMDWSALERLEIGDGYVDDRFVDLVAPRLGGVKHLRLGGFGEERRAAETRLIRSLPRENQLESLEWVRGGLSMDEELLPVLERHGGSLKKLHISDTNPWPGSGLPAAWIGTIAEEASNIENFTFAMDRNGTWPLETFQALTKMRNLSHVTIHMQLQSECGRLHDSMSIIEMGPDDTTRFEVCDRADPYYEYQRPMPTLSNAYFAFDKLQEFVRHADFEDYIANMKADMAAEEGEERLPSPGEPTPPAEQPRRLTTLDFKSGDFGRGYDGPLAILSDWEGRRNHVRCVKALPPPGSAADVVIIERDDEEQEVGQVKRKQGSQRYGKVVGQPSCFHIEGHLYPWPDASEPDWAARYDREDYPGRVIYV